MLPMKKNSQYLVVSCFELLQRVRWEVFPRVRAAAVYRQFKKLLWNLSIFLTNFEQEDAYDIAFFR